MLDSEVNAVIFDIGEVLVKHKKPKNIATSSFLVPNPGKLEWGKEAVKALSQFERGFFSPKQFYRKLRPYMKQKISFAAFSRKWVAIFDWQLGMAAFARRLHNAGYKVGIVSNIDKLAYAAVMKKYDLSSFVDASALSFKVHSNKPSKAIFRSIVRQLKEKPKNCIFIDDQPRHCYAAEKLGFGTIVYKNFPQLKKELEQAGVKVKEAIEW